MFILKPTRGVATGGWGTVSEQGPTVSVSNTRDIAFYGCSEIILTRNLTIFTVYATIFEQFLATSNYIEIDHFKLDLLKMSDT